MFFLQMSRNARLYHAANDLIKDELVFFLNHCIKIQNNKHKILQQTGVIWRKPDFLWALTRQHEKKIINTQMINEECGDFLFCLISCLFVFDWHKTWFNWNFDIFHAIYTNFKWFPGHLHIKISGYFRSIWIKNIFEAAIIMDGKAFLPHKISVKFFPFASEKLTWGILDHHISGDIVRRALLCHYFATFHVNFKIKFTQFSTLAVQYQAQGFFIKKIFFFSYVLWCTGSIRKRYVWNRQWRSKRSILMTMHNTLFHRSILHSRWRVKINLTRFFCPLDFWLSLENKIGGIFHRFNTEFAQ